MVVFIEVGMDSLYRRCFSANHVHELQCAMKGESNVKGFDLTQSTVDCIKHIPTLLFTLRSSSMVRDIHKINSTLLFNSL